MSKKENSFSVIMTVYDQARQLQEYLPAFLTQEYEPGYEVIVVDESSTDDTDDVLKLFKQEHPHLYSTFLPKPNRDITRRKLAFSLGIKASKHDWVILTDIGNTPDGAGWLGELAESITGSTDALIGYYTKKGLRLQAFDEASQTASLVGKAERKRRKVRRGRLLKYLCGRYDFVAVRRSKAYDVLRSFEQDISPARLMALRLSVMLHNCFS